MPKIGLALSGGGFRATLYHLGVVRFLRDADALDCVTDIASVSGGSILAAHMVLNWDRYNGDEASFDEAAAEIVQFVQFDLRNHIVRRLPFQLVLRMLSKLPFVDCRDFTSNALLERYYEKHLYGDRCLHELPVRPMLHILATSVSTGALSAFNRRGLFIQQRGRESSRPFTHVPGQLASISRVVGASSAFPGFFPPVQISSADLGVRDGQFPTEFFTDGGVFDNLGLRAFLWLQEQDAHYDQILVSDAGKPFQILSDTSLSFIGQSVRASDILWDRVWQLERENFGQRKGFSFLPISETVELAEDPTALHPVVQAEIPSIRTDLDRFSIEEINSLAQHGYEVARKRCRQHNLLGSLQLPDAPPWVPLPSEEATQPASSLVSHGSAALPTRIARQLRKSSQRRVWTTLLDWRDWPSYVYFAIAFVLLFFVPLQVYQLYDKSQMQAEIIDAIASGDTDIREILHLATTDPTSDWTSDEVLEKPDATHVSYEGLEILSHSRIYDLRNWHPDEKLPEQRGHVYLRDRITMKFLPSYEGNGRVAFVAPIGLRDVEFRQPNPEIQSTISRITGAVDQVNERPVYEFEYDLSHVLPEEPVNIEVEIIGELPKTVRAPFTMHMKTDLISAWLLFPADRPYRTYSLVSYPVDMNQPPKMMNKRYAIDHPYGSLIGWSVVNPKDDHVYECRWTTD